MDFRIFPSFFYLIIAFFSMLVGNFFVVQNLMKSIQDSQIFTTDIWRTSFAFSLIGLLVLGMYQWLNLEYFANSLTLCGLPIGLIAALFFINQSLLAWICKRKF